LDALDDADLVVSLRAFYSTVRARIMQLQAGPDADQLEDLANLIRETGVAWQMKERSASSTAQGLISIGSAQQQEGAQMHGGSKRLRLDA
jgi:flagellin-specific chaperone FliS